MVWFVVLLRREAWRGVVIKSNALKRAFDNRTRRAGREKLDGAGRLGLPRSDQTRPERPET